MTVKVIKAFQDLKENKWRTVGEIFTVSPNRLKELEAFKYGKLVEVIKESKSKAKVKRSKNVRTNKK